MAELIEKIPIVSQSVYTPAQALANKNAIVSTIRSKYSGLISGIAAYTNVPSVFIESYIFLRSKGNPNLVNQSLIGLMQIDTVTASDAIMREKKAGRLSAPEEAMIKKVLGARHSVLDAVKVYLSNKDSITKTLDSTQLSNAKLILSALPKYGISNKFLQAGILANDYKEIGLKKPRAEDSKSTTPADSLRSQFGKQLSKYSNSEIDTLKKNDKQFFEIIYGGWGGNDKAGDGYLYRARGFNQITFKPMYDYLGKKMGIDLINNPDLLNEPKYAAEANAIFFKDAFADGLKRGIFEKFGVKSMSDIKDITTATKIAVQINMGLGKAWSDTLTGYQIALKVAPDFAKNLVGVVEEKLIITTQDLLLPVFNILVGTMLLKQLIDTFTDSTGKVRLDKVAVIYNIGTSNPIAKKVIDFIGTEEQLIKSLPKEPATIVLQLLGVNGLIQTLLK